MISGLWRNKENILYTVLTVFLLERVRKGWNRIADRGRASNLDISTIERKQQTHLFVAALLYALPFVMPATRYVYRSFGELSQHVAGLEVMSSLWALALVMLFVEGVLSIVIYNLLGIYIERMNAALGFFRKLGRSVIDGSRVAAQAPVTASAKALSAVRHAAARSARRSHSVAGRAIDRTVRSGRGAWGLTASGFSRVRTVATPVTAPGTRFARRLARSSRAHLTAVWTRMS